MKTDFLTLTEAIRYHAQKNPKRLALVFLAEDGAESYITCADFDRLSEYYAGALEEIGIGQGDLVILVLRHSLELLYSFWGTIKLGAIASIFPFLTEKLDAQIYFQRVKQLVSQSAVKVVITFPEFKPELEKLLQDSSAIVLSTAEVNLQSSSTSRSKPGLMVSADQIAFLQHSSGTTGLQKGVALSHRAVLNQLESYSNAIGLKQTDVIVSWLPLYHDMGLIAGFVLPLTVGIPLVLMSPFKWVRDPKTLLKAISDHRGTLCWLPNFAYNHSARVIRMQDLDGVDLSGMRAFINCSEPVHLYSHQAFLERFAPYGVREDMLAACYAMAENTFAVTQSPIGKVTRCDWVNTRKLQEQRYALPGKAREIGSTPMISCGFAIEGTELRVMGSNDQCLPERRVGEIAIKSDCMLSEYYQRSDLTQKAIRDGWFFTGDMGYLADGELFITGRKKDLIIVGGKNIYPQDLEAVALEVKGLLPGRSVAFGVFDPRVGSENVVMVCEVGEEILPEIARKEIELELRSRVVARSEIALSDVRLVPSRWLIKTSSGKISRSSNRDKYLAQFMTNSSEEV